MLGVHFVFEDIVLLDGTERPKPDVERHVCRIDTHYARFGELRLREVKSRRGSRRRARLAAVYRIVAVFIFQLFRDVRRQRHLSNSVQNIVKVALIGKPNKSVAALESIENLRGQSLGKINYNPGL